MSDTRKSERNRVRLFTSAVDVLHTSVEWICVALLAAMIVVTVYQVFMRSVLNDATSWSEEIALLLMIWFGYLGMAIGIREKTHISMEFVFDRLPRVMRVVIDAIGRVLVSVFACAMVWEGIRLTSISAVQRFPATRLPRGSMYLVLVLSGSLMLIYIVEAVVKTFRDVRADRGDTKRG